MYKTQGGFTLIELIMVIVILGLLAVTAIPKYIDLQSEAKDASAKGVYGAAQAAAAINHAGKLVRKTTTNISNGTTLLGAMEGTPDGWEVDDTGTVLEGIGICTKPTTDGDCTTAEYFIKITDIETSIAKAKLTKSGTVTTW
jgi:MSHA pilin protein MshA